jgi:hypothetical protein
MMTAWTIGMVVTTWYLSALPQEEKVELGNPPQVILVAGIDPEGRLIQVEYRTIYIGFDGSGFNSRSTHTVDLADVKIMSMQGEILTLSEVRERLGKREQPVVVMSDGVEPLNGFRRLFQDDVICFVFPRRAPSWRPIQDPQMPLEK